MLVQRRLMHASVVGQVAVLAVALLLLGCGQSEKPHEAGLPKVEFMSQPGMKIEAGQAAVVYRHQAL